jgi:DNA-binding response OmpR family regulator
MSAPAIHQIGPLTFDPSRREMRLAQSEVISLTPLENRLLDYLMLNAGHVLTAQAIIEHIWGSEGGDRDMLRQLVHRLRSKLALATASGAASPDTAITNESGPTQLPRIETIPGLGYGLVIDSDQSPD